jgi:hypothetical protein
MKTEDVRLLVRFVVGVFSIGLAFILSEADFTPHPTFQPLEQAIKQELPPGTDWQEEQAFLDRKQIRHTESLELLPLDKASILINPDGDKLRGKEDRLRHRISGYSRVANWKPELFCGCGRVHVEFYFNERERLVEYIAYEFGDGF